MKSIKRGRGPSMMGGFSSIFAVIFGVIWTILAVSGGAGLFALFGVVFIAFAVVQAVYSFKNATGDNRFSEFDITDDGEEPDPFNVRFGQKYNAEQGQEVTNYCPYCGAKVEDDYLYCRKCGRKL